MERIAYAAVREGVFDNLTVANAMILNEKSKKNPSSLRGAAIEAVAMKGLDPHQNTESVFRKAMAFHLEDPNASEQMLPGLFDRLVGEVVRSVIEERLLGSASSSGLQL